MEETLIISASSTFRLCTIYLADVVSFFKNAEVDTLRQVSHPIQQAVVSIPLSRRPRRIHPGLGIEATRPKRTVQRHYGFTLTRANGSVEELPDIHRAEMETHLCREAKVWLELLMVCRIEC